MNFIKTNITAILLVFIAVLTTLQVKSCLTKTVSTDKYYQEKIEAVRAQQEQVLKERNEMRVKYDSLLATDRRRDTLLIERYKTNTIKYEAIPVYINNLSADSLFRAVHNY